MSNNSLNLCSTGNLIEHLWLIVLVPFESTTEQRFSSDTRRQEACILQMKPTAARMAHAEEVKDQK